MEDHLVTVIADQANGQCALQREPVINGGPKFAQRSTADGPAFRVEIRVQAQRHHRASDEKVPAGQTDNVVVLDYAQFGISSKGDDYDQSGGDNPGTEEDLIRDEEDARLDGQ